MLFIVFHSIYNFQCRGLYETIYTIPVNNSTETNLTDINEKNQQEDIDIQKSTGNPLLILLILLGIIGFCPLKRD